MPKVKVLIECEVELDSDAAVEFFKMTAQEKPYDFIEDLRWPYLENEPNRIVKIEIDTL